jgi:hypothetical protein
MESGLGYGLSQTDGTSTPVEAPSYEVVARMENDINDLIGALAVLGVERCSKCKQFFRKSDPGAVFDCGSLICYECVPDWWSAAAGQLGAEEHRKLEGKLGLWLRRYHQAEVIRQSRKSSDTRELKFELVTRCLECQGSGKILDGERCRFCDGGGTVRIAVPK